MSIDLNGTVEYVHRSQAIVVQIDAREDCLEWHLADLLAFIEEAKTPIATAVRLGSHPYLSIAIWRNDCISLPYGLGVVGDFPLSPTFIQQLAAHSVGVELCIDITTDAPE